MFFCLCIVLDDICAERNKLYTLGLLQLINADAIGIKNASFNLKPSFYKDFAGI